MLLIVAIVGITPGCAAACRTEAAQNTKSAAIPAVLGAAGAAKWEFTADDLFRDDVKMVSDAPAVIKEPEPEPCTITDDEIVMLAKIIKVEAEGVSGTRWGVSAKARQAAVAWTALNRLDTGDYGATLTAVLTAPYQFA